MAHRALVAAMSALAVLSGGPPVAAAAQEPVGPSVAVPRAVAASQRDAALEARARELFARLLALSHLPGPVPELVISLEPLHKAKAEYSKVIVTRKLLRLCASLKPPVGQRPEESRDALIAFVLAHELEHLARGDLGSFGSRTASSAVERDADDKAAGRLVVAGIPVDAGQIWNLLAAIGQESAHTISRSEALQRRNAVRASLKDAAARSRDWHVGWLLTVAGRFDQALDFYTNVAGKYPYRKPMYTLAITRLQTAWRRSPCSDPVLLEWLPPLRYDPRTQTLPFEVRGPDDACVNLLRELDRAAMELAQVGDDPPAQIALAALRLMKGPDNASIDPTRSIGGVKGVGVPCPAAATGERSPSEADACHVSLLAQYEMTRRSPESRALAIAGLRDLHERWPSEPSLQFNLARILTQEGRPAEARPLWEKFLEAPGNGLHRREAEAALRLSAGPDAPPAPSPAAAGPLPAGAGASPDRLQVVRRDCRSDLKWKSFSSASALSYCGDWRDEMAVRNRAGALIRSVAFGSRAWPDAAPPTTPPLFVTRNELGEELRIWDQEAWVLDGKTPRRVVYFTKPR